MKLVEVVQGTQTAEETMQRAIDFGEKLGKTCVRAKDTPGFVVNRVGGRDRPHRKRGRRVHDGTV